jgi:hypothetical protein
MNTFRYTLIPMVCLLVIFCLTFIPVLQAASNNTEAYLSELSRGSSRESFQEKAQAYLEHLQIVHALAKKTPHSRLEVALSDLIFWTGELAVLSKKTGMQKSKKLALLKIHLRNVDNWTEQVSFFLRSAKKNPAINEIVQTWKKAELQFNRLYESLGANCHR